jgi:uncharacterized membrane protein YeaQ/YmgE (transglycosylase-associated protein family)
MVARLDHWSIWRTVGAVLPQPGAVAATGTPLVLDRWPCWTGERVDYSDARSEGCDRCMRRSPRRTPSRTKGSVVLILVLLAVGMAIGWAAQLIMGASRATVDWTLALVAGVLGSFVGGTIGSLLSGDGLDVRPSGIIGSLVGAIIVVLVWQRVIAPRRARR